MPYLLTSAANQPITNIQPLNFRCRDSLGQGTGSPASGVLQMLREKRVGVVVVVVLLLGFAQTVVVVVVVNRDPRLRLARFTVLAGYGGDPPHTP